MKIIISDTVHVDPLSGWSQKLKVTSNYLKYCRIGVVKMWVLIGEIPVILSSNGSRSDLIFARRGI